MLRPWRRSDLDDASEGWMDPDVCRFAGSTVHRPSDARRHLDGQALAAVGGTELVFAIADPDTDRFLGSVSVLRIAWEQARAEIGYWLAPWGRGRGAATAAVRALADWAVATYGFRRIELFIEPANVASLAVAERAGFTRERTLRSYELVQGRPLDLVLWSWCPAGGTAQATTVSAPG